MTGPSSVRVAISADFLDAFSQIPRSQQSKVRSFVEKFKANPTSPGINYEKISSFKDPKLRSVRIDQAYRGIVLKPETGNVYMLLWVDHHDKAYRWAENKVYEIHPETGGIQVVDVEEASRPPEMEESAPEEKGLFDGYRERELLRLGVPESLLPLVYTLKTPEVLDAVQSKLPQEAYEALFLLAAGYSLQEVDREMQQMYPKRGEVDPTDYAAALENPDSKRRFHVVEDELELAEILSAPLEKWRVFLHPAQRRFVEMKANGPVRVLGGAGTGKTVVAMHRARYLVEHVFERPEQRLLFTTFTRNLAEDIRENLAKICPDKLMERIEVVNLDQWVHRFLRGHGYEYEIAYGDRTDPLWDEALAVAPDLGLPPSFYREEWRQVVQANDIGSVREYMRVPRVGRGTRLSRRQRKEIWPVFQEYQALLDENKLREPDGAMRDARILLQEKGDVLPYRSIIVDEAQDLGAQAFKLIRSMVPEQPHDIFIVGDAHQRIYRHPIVLSHCGIDIRGRGRRLRINYRTTEETRRWAVNLLEGVSVDDLDGGEDDQSGYKSLLHGVEPEVHPFDSFRDEVEYIVSYLKGVSEEERKQICLVARTGTLLDQFKGALQANGIETYAIQQSEPEDRSAPGVRLATMHRVKGLEFDRVIIAGVNDDVVPLSYALKEAASEAERVARETRERSLLYVAATRARTEVQVTCHGTPSRFL